MLNGVKCYLWLDFLYRRYPGYCSFFYWSLIPSSRDLIQTLQPYIQTLSSFQQKWSESSITTMFHKFNAIWRKIVFIEILLRGNVLKGNTFPTTSSARQGVKNSYPSKLAMRLPFSCQKSRSGLRVHSYMDKGRFWRPFGYILLISFCHGQF